MTLCPQAGVTLLLCQRQPCQADRPQTDVGTLPCPGRLRWRGDSAPSPGVECRGSAPHARLRAPLVQPHGLWPGDSSQN